MKEKRVSFRIRRIYYDQIVAGTKTVELRAMTKFWEDRLIYTEVKPTIAVFVCGKDVHRRRIERISWGEPKQFLGRELSEQGARDIPTRFCIGIRLGDEYMED